MTKYVQRVALSIFQAFNQTQQDHLIDFNCLINQDIKIINSTAHLYNSKTSKHQSKESYKLATKEEAAQGDIPDLTYEVTAFIKREDAYKNIKYFSNFSQRPYIGQPTFNNIKNLSFIALHKNGTSNQIRSHKIVSGDIIKLGSVILKVCQTHLSNVSVKNVLSIKETTAVQGKSKESNDLNQACRICLMESDLNDVTQQLVSICDCKGSCQYVHISCLKTWICSKVQKQQSQCLVSYYLEKLQCQICKKKLPFQIKMKQVMHNLIQFVKPKMPYLILQKINEQSKNRTIYMLVFKKQKICIGRGFSNDLRLFDISISRSHTSVIFEGQNFILSDQGSKYGTMILSNKELEIKERVNMCFKSKIYKFELINSEIIKI